MADTTNIVEKNSYHDSRNPYATTVTPRSCDIVTITSITTQLEISSFRDISEILFLDWVHYSIGDMLIAP